MNGQSEQIRQQNINTNTYVSVGILITLITGLSILLGSIYSAKSELSVNQFRFETKVDGLTSRVDKFEKARETWSYQDMFKWAVHLQRDNPTLKIPEPAQVETTP